MSLFCAVIALGGLGVAVWLAIGALGSVPGIDTLFLILVCLLIALIFSYVPVREYGTGVFLGLARRNVKAAASPAPHIARPETQERQERSSRG